jgi:hypothetical protein
MLYKYNLFIRTSVPVHQRIGIREVFNSKFIWTFQRIKVRLPDSKVVDNRFVGNNNKIFRYFQIRGFLMTKYA